MRSLLLLAPALVALAAGCSAPRPTLSENPAHRTPLTLDIPGPEASEDADANPFLDYRLSVVFTHAETRETYIVPGFYAADGQAADTSASAGPLWRVRFTPTEPGLWQWRANFRTGPNVALDFTEEGQPAPFDNATGEFTAAPAPAHARGFLRWHREHYLRFDDGRYFLKGGADSPENFLAYFEFDGTTDTATHADVQSDDAQFLHRFEPHAVDWREGDPTWQGNKGKNIIGALNYLASAGMNSVYFLTYNLDGGDGQDVWPWTTPQERRRFDVSKLAQWERVFTHMDRLGLMLHVVLQETENDTKLGGDATLNPVRMLYLRELIARFAHHPALVWNLGEESNLTPPQAAAMAAFIRDLDPYDHPIAIHTKNRRALEIYDPLLGLPLFEATSIQGDMDAANDETIKLRVASRLAGRPWVIFHDEQAPAAVGVAPDSVDPTHDAPRKQELWGNLMGGGAGVEWYFGYDHPHTDLNAEDWRSREQMWAQTRIALDFFHEYLPFWEMWPANELVQARGALCLAAEGRLYAVYLPNGGSTRIALPDGQFQIRWFNPRTGGALQIGSIETLERGGKPSLGQPPADPDQDWVVLITRPDNL